MNQKMILKSASAKGMPEGNFMVRLSLETQCSADLMRDIVSDASEMLDQDVEVKIEPMQKRMIK